MRRIAFDKLPVLESAQGVSYQSVSTQGRQIRLVEFAPDFCETEWCNTGHIGYITHGRLEVAFADGTTETFAAGDGLVIEAGDAHRARVAAGPVRIFLVEDI